MPFLTALNSLLLNYRNISVQSTPLKPTSNKPTLRLIRQFFKLPNHFYTLLNNLLCLIRQLLRLIRQNGKIFGNKTAIKGKNLGEEGLRGPKKFGISLIY